MALREQLQQTLGSSYTLERELGGGGMSRVFLAEESALGRKVVIKVLPPEIAAGVSVERFRREIQLAARLQHPHIVPVLSSGEMEGVPYYTMPFVEGESVRARLARSGALSITEAIGILRDVAKALAYAHERGIVHRDIKPDNVLLSGGSATVADFGIAKAIAAARAEGDTGIATLTQIGSSLGTPAYMAPEQAAADPSTNHRADIYAFGCMAYELLAGRPPFVAKNPQRLLAAQMGDTPDPITAHRPDTPPELAELVMDCLAKDADARPQQAADIVRVLDTVTSGGGHQAMPRVLLAGEGMLPKALAAYAAAFVFVAILAKASIVAIGLPSWVFPGALIVMALGLPVILFTAYSHRATKLAVTQTPTFTPGGSRRSSGTMATLAIKAGPHLSWRRTWLGGVLAVGAFVVLIGMYMASRALGVGPFGSLMAAGALGQNEKLLVADFDSPNDTSMGPVVTEAFRTALAQSRSISLFQPNEVRDVLLRMQRAATTKVDFGVARQIASREGIKGVVQGNVLNVRGNYVVSVQLMSAQTGEELASFRETANSDEALLPAIDELAKDMRARIGESLRAVQASLPLERVTTPSMEALKKYVQGSRVMSFDGDFPKGVALLEQAIALDTGFAMAYRRLAVEYSNRNQPDRAMQLLQKAYDHQNRLSDAERYLVLGSYYQRGPRQDIEKSTAAYEALIELQPDHQTPLNNVVINYRWQRDWVKSEEYLKRILAIGNAPAVTYNQLIWTYWNQGKRDSAWMTLAQLDSAYPNNMQRYMRRAELLFSERKFDSANKVRDAMLRERPSDPTVRAPALNGTTLVARTQGRLQEARRAREELARVNLARGNAQAPLGVALDEATEHLLFFNSPKQALEIVDRALAKTPVETLNPAVRPYVGLVAVYSTAGRPDKARQIQQLFERDRKDVVRTSDDQDRRIMRGFIAMGEKRVPDAVAAFSEAASIGDCPSCDLPDLGNALDAAGRADSALAVYESYLNMSDVYRAGSDQWYLAPTHKRVGELYEAKGDRQKALSNYLQFVELWKNADPALQPRVAEVKARIARLKDTEGR
ncbi:MAG TPA: protein kinase [Gemmatimonadaceae bacterium]|nr:protein kinase [Gemmatimonadaceae bacterium]